MRGLDSTPKTFQTPVSHRVNAPRTEPFASTLETPKSAMKLSKDDNQSLADEEKTTASMDSDESNDIKIDRKENPKIKFVQMADSNEQNYHTPISFKMNKFIMCFKSEPDLSRVQNITDDAPILNRGRFIAKKLLSGVSMINLRRPFGNASEKPTTTTSTTSTTATTVEMAEKIETTEASETSGTATNEESNEESMQNASESLKVAQHETEACTVSSIATPSIVTDDDKIDDDDEDFVDDEEVDREYDDSVDKENQIPLQCKNIDFISKLEPVKAITNCALSDSIATVNDSVSPITKSTHRMSKAMQVKS